MGIFPSYWYKYIWKNSTVNHKSISLMKKAIPRLILEQLKWFIKINKYEKQQQNLQVTKRFNN